MALHLLQGRAQSSQREGKEFDSVDYYETPLTAGQLRQLLHKLALPARAILRRDEPLARSLKFEERQVSDDELIRIMKVPIDSASELSFW